MTINYWWWNKRQYWKYQLRVWWRLVGSPAKWRRYRRWERKRQGYYAYLEAVRQIRVERARWRARQQYRAWVRAGERR